MTSSISLFDLPVDCIYEIALQHPEIHYKLCLVLKSYYFYSKPLRQQIQTHFTEIVEDFWYEDTYLKYTINDKCHREDGPAIIYSSGQHEYYQYGKRHREDGPAIIYSSGQHEYYQYDKRHRGDGPAVIYPSGMHLYYQFDKLHRESGPAIIFSNGLHEYYQYGKRHREDGPAVIYPDGSCE